MIYLAFVTPLVAGVFALSGAWVGALLSRRNEYDKWLRQARTEAFVNFLRNLNDCEDQIYANKLSKDDAIELVVWVQSQLQPAFNEARIVRLFLSSNERERLHEYLMMILNGHSTPAGSNMQRAKGVEAIQQLLESNLLHG